MIADAPFRLSRAATRDLARVQLIVGLVGLLMILISVFVILPGPGSGSGLAHPMAAAGFALGIIFPFVITFFALVPGWPDDKCINVSRERKTFIKINTLRWVNRPALRPPRLRLV